MKKRFNWLILIGLILLFVSLTGMYLTKASYKDIDQYGPVSTSNSVMQGYRWNDDYRKSDVSEGEKLDLEVLHQKVLDYIAYYDEKLLIGDVFIYEDGDYYYSILEEESQLGAMELLVNPYTGDVYPEYGPNMMWNLKYSHMGSGHMMQGRARGHGRGMGGSSRTYNQNNNSFYNTSEISHEEGYNIASDYVNDMGSDYSIDSRYHEFYGYFTFHILQGDKTIGMLSVNAYSGDIWYHDWHGELVEVMELHESHE